MGIVSSYTLGVVFILLVAIIWSAASILVQYLYTEQSFDSPFLLTYIGTSLFVLLIPTQWLCKRLRRRGNDDRYITISQHSPCNQQPLERQEEIQPLPPSQLLQQPENKYWTTRDHYIAAAKIAPVWFLSNYSYNASLKYTSITSSTILASTGSLFTYLFALILKDEKFSVLKLMGVFLGMTGFIITGLHDAPNTAADHGLEDDERLWGDALSLISAVGYGAYAVMVRVLVPHDESLMSMQLFLGFVGMWNMVFLSPIAIYQLSTTVSLSFLVFGCLILKGLFDNVLSDYLWARAVILTSATVATVGLGLTIPLAFLSDVFMGMPNVLDASSIGGALTVLLGFVSVNVGQQNTENDQEQQDLVDRRLETAAIMEGVNRLERQQNPFEMESDDD